MERKEIGTTLSGLPYKEAEKDVVDCSDRRHQCSCPNLLDVLSLYLNDCMAVFRAKH